LRNRGRSLPARTEVCVGKPKGIRRETTNKKHSEKKRVGRADIQKEHEVFGKQHGKKKKKKENPLGPRGSERPKTRRHDSGKSAPSKRTPALEMESVKGPKKQFPFPTRKKRKKQGKESGGGQTKRNRQGVTIGRKGTWEG